MTDQAGPGDAKAVEQGKHILRHVIDVQPGGERPVGAAGAAMVVEDDAVALGQRREVRRPISSRTAQPGRQHHRRPVRRAVLFPVEPGDLRHQPVCATEAISTTRPGFTSPHWMQ